MTGFKFTWQRALASEYGPSSPTTRLVLHTLGIFMKADGRDCRPSVQTLCKATALSRRTIIEHINRAKAEGWIVKVSAGAGMAGKHWRRSLYLPKIPNDVKHDLQLDQEIRGASPASPNKKVVHLTQKGGASDDKIQNGHLLYEKEKNRESIATEIFDLYVLEIQSERKSKQRAIGNIKAYINRGVSPDTLKAAIFNYKSTLAKIDPKYRKDPANFFGIRDPYIVDFYPENFEMEKNRNLLTSQKEQDSNWKPFNFNWNQKS